MYIYIDISGLHFARGAGSSLRGRVGYLGNSSMHHHTPPVPVEPAVAPVPVLEQESVLDLSRRPSEHIAASNQSSNTEENNGNQ